MPTLLAAPGPEYEIWATGPDLIVITHCFRLFSRNSWFC